MLTVSDLNTAYGAETLKQWADDDRDGTADDSILTAAITAAEHDVADRLYPAFSAVMPFTAATLPQVVKQIMIVFTGYILAGRRQRRPDALQDSYRSAEMRLQSLVQKGATLVLPDGSVAVSHGLPAQGTSSVHSSTLHATPVFTDSSLRGY